MAKNGKLGKYTQKKLQERMETHKLHGMQAAGGRDILKREAQFRIAPKHPGMGRR